MQLTQQDAPLLEALEEHRLNRVVRFAAIKAVEAIRSSAAFSVQAPYKWMLIP